VIVADGKMTPFDCDLDDYRDWMMKSKLAAQNAARNAPTSASASVSTSTASPTAIAPTKIERSDQKKMTAQERQRLAALKKPLTTKLAKLENEMTVVNKELARIEYLITDETIYDATRKDELKSLLEAQVNSKRQLERIESEWLQLNEELEKLSAD
jgi:ATP-binding cassette subfamily F protein 3